MSSISKPCLKCGETKTMARNAKVCGYCNRFRREGKRKLHLVSDYRIYVYLHNCRTMKKCSDDLNVSIRRVRNVVDKYISEFPVVPDGQSWCGKCRMYKVHVEFAKNGSSKNGLNCYCKQCDSARPTRPNKSYAKNEEYYSQMNKAWYVKNREHKLEQSRIWASKNLDKKRLYRHNYRARSNNAKGFATVEQINARMEYFSNKCVYCGGPYESVDHKIPLIGGGSNWPSNLVPACNSCNSKKHTKDFIRFYEKNRYSNSSS